MTTNEIELSKQTRTTLNRYNLAPLWEIAEDKLGKTRENLEASIWKWENLRRSVDLIADDVPPDVSPRVTVPVNPAYGGALSHTISVGVETAPPGDTTAAHRHSGHFLRYAIDGHPDMKTTVGGEEFQMLDDDLITIPQWVWHGHANESNEEVTWLVIDDSPLRIDALNIGNLYEQPDNDDWPTQKRQKGYYRTQYGDYRPPATDDKIPGSFEGIRKPTPPHRFPGDEMLESLDTAENNEDAYTPNDGVGLTYTNPARGSGHLFPTFGVRVHRLLDGKETETHCHNATEVCYVIEGTGQTIVEDEPFDWSDQDIFVVPTYKTHSHKPDNDATILMVSDRPLLEAINCYHEFD